MADSANFDAISYQHRDSHIPAFVPMFRRKLFLILIAAAVMSAYAEEAPAPLRKLFDAFYSKPNLGGGSTQLVVVESVFLQEEPPSGVKPENAPLFNAYFAAGFSITKDFSVRLPRIISHERIEASNFHSGRCFATSKYAVFETQTWDPYTQQFHVYPIRSEEGKWPLVRQVPPEFYWRRGYQIVRVDDSPTEVLLYNSLDSCLFDFITGKITERAGGGTIKLGGGMEGGWPSYHKQTGIVSTCEYFKNVGIIHRLQLKERPGRDEVIELRSPNQEDLRLTPVYGDDVSGEFVMTYQSKPPRLFYCRFLKDGTWNELEITDLSTDAERAHMAAGTCVRVGDRLYSLSTKGEFLRGVKVPTSMKN